MESIYLGHMLLIAARIGGNVVALPCNHHGIGVGLCVAHLTIQGIYGHVQFLLRCEIVLRCEASFRIFGEKIAASSSRCRQQKGG